MADIIKDLGDGLILRHSRAGDAEPLAAFNKQIHAEDKWDGISLEAWTRDLISGKHPTFNVADCTIVEDTNDHKIVSSMNLISQTWTYEGIPFGVGRPELVGTLPAYRRRGLIGEQFSVVHQWSAERGELVQAITGIPYYYRRFGYEMAMNLGGGRIGYAPSVIPLKEGEKEPYSLREAREDDLPLIAELYKLGSQRSLVAAQWDMDLWRYELSGKDRQNINMRLLFIIEDGNQHAVGFVAVPCIKWRTMTVITYYELKPGASWFKITPSVVRWLWRFGEAQGAAQGQKQEAFGFWLGEEHPVYQAYDKYLPKIRESYAWFIRVPDLVKFLNVVTPALEARLAECIVNGYTGLLKLSFYVTGIAMTFENGRITGIQELVGDALAKSSVEFPHLTFLQVLFGWRNLSEVRYLFPDCSWRNDEVKVLVDALFPRKASDVWPIS